MFVIFSSMLSVMLSVRGQASIRCRLASACRMVTGSGCW